jgi:hypothetical protein
MSSHFREKINGFITYLNYLSIRKDPSLFGIDGLFVKGSRRGVLGMENMVSG